MLLHVLQQNIVLKVHEANKSQLQQCFAALKGSVSILSIVALGSKLIGDHIAAVEASSIIFSIYFQKLGRLVHKAIPLKNAQQMLK